MCRYISAKHGGKDICGDGLSVVVFSDKRDIIWLSGCTVCRLGTGAGGMGEKRDKKDGCSRHYSFFVGVFWRCGIALYPVGYRQDTVADTMDCFDMLAVYLRQMTWQDRELQKEFIRIQDDDREYNRMLKLKNRYLIEKQDAQVYSATLKERNRIAREIHDNVGHLLSRALIQTGAVIAVSRDEQTKPLLLSIKETLDCAMNNIRNSVHDLHDESVDLEQTVREMTEKAEGYTVSYEYDMSQDLPKELKYCIISIVKEALSNVTRHSDADRVKLLLREHPAFYQILIQDNGKCVHPGDGTGIGITNMRQRVETFGGTIDIRTENGYRIFIHIPKADIPAGR